MDDIQKYQNLTSLHDNAIKERDKALAQAEVYKKNLKDSLAEEGVTSISELADLYKAKVQELQAINSLMEKELETALPALQNLRNLQS